MLKYITSQNRNHYLHDDYDVILLYLVIGPIHLSATQMLIEKVDNYILSFHLIVESIIFIPS